MGPGTEKEAEETLEETQGNTSSLSSFSLCSGRRRGVAPARWTVAGRRSTERCCGVVPAAGGGAGSFLDSLDVEAGGALRASQVVLPVRVAGGSGVQRAGREPDVGRPAGGAGTG